MTAIYTSALVTFYEEARDTLLQIESWVLSLQQQPSSGFKRWQDICGQLHTLKGTAASFGNEAIASICHAMENVLQNPHSLTHQEVDGLLSAIDSCRQCLQTEVSDPTLLQKVVTDCISKLKRFTSAYPQSAATTLSPEISGSLWQIDFTPHADFFENGHDPLRIIKQLRQLGTLEISVFTDKLPDFADFDPYRCYLRWRIILQADLEHQQLAAEFEWVKHKADIDLQVLTLPKQDRLSEVRYTIREMDLNILSNLTEQWQQQLEQTLALVQRLDATDKIRLSRRCHAMKRQQQLVQRQLINVSMQPLAEAFTRLPRLAYDLGQKTDKPVQLHMDIAPVEFDSQIIHALIDPLTHLLRNAVAHGIEPRETRQQSGKPEAGQIHISAQQIEDELVIRFSDDGAGLSLPKIQQKASQMGMDADSSVLNETSMGKWIFRSGFSTAESVDAVSGRGLGLDVVKKHITDLGGQIEVISTTGKGCCFNLHLPVQQVLMDVQLIRIANQLMALPLLNVQGSQTLDSQRVIWQRGKKWFITDDNRQIPLFDMHKFLALPVEVKQMTPAVVTLVDAGNSLFAISAEGLAKQTQLLIKSLLPNYRAVPGVKGIAILPYNALALLLDPEKLLLSFHAMETQGK